MPVSKKRKKKGGSVAKFKKDRYAMRRRQIEMDIENGEHMSTNLTLQDLINVVAYQEYQEKGLIEGPALPDDADVAVKIDFDDPDHQAIIRAAQQSGEDDTKVQDEEENEDGR